MFRSLGMNISDTVVTHHDHTLIKNGLYRSIRRSLYTFGYILFFCLSLVTSIKLIPVLAIPTSAILFKHPFIEEQVLQLRFCAEYQRYSDRTGLFSPLPVHNLSG